MNSRDFKVTILQFKKERERDCKVIVLSLAGDVS